MIKSTLKLEGFKWVLIVLVRFERNWQIFARSTARALNFSFHSIRKSKQINTFSHRDAERFRFPAIGIEPPHNAERVDVWMVLATRFSSVN